MLGRTHMAIGAVASIAATPLILHKPWENLHQLVGSPHVLHAPAGVLTQALVVVTAVVGSLLPDMDQRDSLAARKVERLGQVVSFLLITLLMFLMHWQTHVYLWGLILFVSLALGSGSNTARIIGLGVLGGALLYLGVTHRIEVIGAFLLAIWIMGAIFTKHRTFTHSLLGTVAFNAGSLIVFSSLGTVDGIHLTAAAYGLLVGYVFHLIADIVSGGVPLLWPWSKRQGIRLVTTGRASDYLVGAIATIAFIGLVFV